MIAARITGGVHPAEQGVKPGGQQGKPYIYVVPSAKHQDAEAETHADNDAEM